MEAESSCDHETHGRAKRKAANKNRRRGPSPKEVLKVFRDVVDRKPSYSLIRSL